MFENNRKTRPHRALAALLALPLVMAWACTSAVDPMSTAHSLRQGQDAGDGTASVEAVDAAPTGDAAAAEDACRSAPMPTARGIPCAMQLVVAENGNPSSLLFVHLQGGTKEKEIYLVGGGVGERIQEVELTAPNFWVQVGETKGFTAGYHMLEVAAAAGQPVPIRIEWTGAPAQGQLRLLRPGCPALTVGLRGTP
ncbi:MAG: hypothetical protein H6747_04920 [Deltaproteobacteria bacterium]|nr:hypothetical protein [Deltaproteobacteria bacterium]